MRCVVYTALIGPSVPTRLLAPPVAATRTVTYVCFTDREAEHEIPDPWIVLTPPVAGDPRYVARMVKMRSDQLFPSADVSLWVDATFQLLRSPREAIRDAPQGALVVGFSHPDRRRASEEARVVCQCGLAPASAVRSQLAAYQAAGFDTDAAPMAALTTTGYLLRWHTPSVRAFNSYWEAELHRHTLRDQLSIDYAAQQAGVTVGYLPGHYRENRYAEYDRSRRTGRQRLRV